MSCWVYVLKSDKNGRLYVGITSRLRRRLCDHNLGLDKSTAPHAPYRLVHREKFTDHSRAREREKFLKTGSGREFLNSLDADSRP